MRKSRDLRLITVLPKNAGICRSYKIMQRKRGITFEEVVGISYDYDYIDDDEAFDRDYEAYAEFEWECRTGR